MPGLAVFFFLTALLYGAAGFGGGSTYNALLVLAGTDYRAVPVVALVCNILVVTAGSWRFARSGHVDWRRIWPLFVLSIPFAWLGGRLVVAELVFVGLLAASLLVAGLLMLWQPLWEKEGPLHHAATLRGPCSGRPVPRTGLNRAGHGSPEHPLEIEGRITPAGAGAVARSRWLEPAAGGALGFLAGMVGIGGG